VGLSQNSRSASSRKIKNAILISERPAEVEDRAVLGHWKGILIAGSNNSYIATLVERHSRFVMLSKVANKDTQSVTKTLIKQTRKLPKEIYKSPTCGRGSEMAGHRNFTIPTKRQSQFSVYSVIQWGLVVNVPNKLNCKHLANYKTN